MTRKRDEGARRTVQPPPSTPTISPPVVEHLRNISSRPARLVRKNNVNSKHFNLDHELRSLKRPRFMGKLGRKGAVGLLIVDVSSLRLYTAT